MLDAQAGVAAPRPRAHSSTSLSASASQKWFSPRRSSTGSLMMPPSSAVMTTYLPWPTAQRERSRGVSMLVNANASGPVISTWRSTDTSHSVTCIEQVPVLFLQVGEADREQHVVVDVYAFAP